MKIMRVYAIVNVGVNLIIPIIERLMVNFSSAKIDMLYASTSVLTRITILSGARMWFRGA